MGPDEPVSRTEISAFAEFVFENLARISLSVANLMELLRDEGQANAIPPDIGASPKAGNPKRASVVPIAVGKPERPD